MKASGKHWQSVMRWMDNSPWRTHFSKFLKAFNVYRARRCDVSVTSVTNSAVPTLPALIEHGDASKVDSILPRRESSVRNAESVLKDMISASSESLEDIANSLVGASNHTSVKNLLKQDAAKRKQASKEASEQLAKMKDSGGGGFLGGLMKFVKIATIVASVAGAAFTGGASLAVGLAVAGAMMSLAAKPLVQSTGARESGRNRLQHCRRGIEHGSGWGSCFVECHRSARENGRSRGGGSAKMRGCCEVRGKVES